MTVKRALLAVVLGTTIGTSYALWDERDRGPSTIATAGASDFASPPAPSPPIAPERVIPAAALVKADAGSGALPSPAPTPGTPRDRLYADLDRAKLDASPEVERLVKMQRKGVKPRVLRAYVRTRFPKNARLRLVVGRWIKSLEPARASRQARARAGL